MRTITMSHIAQPTGVTEADPIADMDPFMANRGLPTVRTRVVAAEDLKEGQLLHVVFQGADGKTYVDTGQLEHLNEAGDMYITGAGGILNAHTCVVILLIEDVITRHEEEASA